MIWIWRLLGAAAVALSSAASAAAGPTLATLASADPEERLAVADRLLAERPAGLTSAVIAGLTARLAPAPGTAARIRQQVARLGSSRFDEREQAMVALRSLGPVSIPALRAAVAGGDPETRWRARRLLREVGDGRNALVELLLLAAELGDRRHAALIARALGSSTPTVRAAADLALRTVLRGGPALGPGVWLHDRTGLAAGWAGYLTGVAVAGARPGRSRRAGPLTVARGPLTLSARITREMTRQGATTSRRRTVSSRYIGRLVRSGAAAQVDRRLLAHTVEPATGDALRPGQRLELTSGPGRSLMLQVGDENPPWAYPLDPGLLLGVGLPRLQGCGRAPLSTAWLDRLAVLLLGYLPASTKLASRGWIARGARPGQLQVWVRIALVGPGHVFRLYLQGALRPGAGFGYTLSGPAWIEDDEGVRMAGGQRLTCRVAGRGR